MSHAEMDCARLLAMLASRRRRVMEGEPLRSPGVRMGLRSGRMLQGSVAAVELGMVTLDDREGRRTWLHTEDVEWVEISDYANFDSPPEGHSPATVEQLRQLADQLGVILGASEPLDGLVDTLQVYQRIQPHLQRVVIVGALLAIGPRQVKLEQGVLHISRGEAWPDRWTPSALLAAIEACA